MIYIKAITKKDEETWTIVEKPAHFKAHPDQSVPVQDGQVRTSLDKQPLSC